MIEEEDGLDALLLVEGSKLGEEGEPDDKFGRLREPHFWRGDPGTGELHPERLERESGRETG